MGAQEAHNELGNEVQRNNDNAESQKMIEGMGQDIAKDALKMSLSPSQTVQLADKTIADARMFGVSISTKDEAGIKSRALALVMEGQLFIHGQPQEQPRQKTPSDKRPSETTFSRADLGLNAKYSEKFAQEKPEELWKKGMQLINDIMAKNPTHDKVMEGDNYVAVAVNVPPSGVDYASTMAGATLNEYITKKGYIPHPKPFQKATANGYCVLFFVEKPSAVASN